MISRWRLHEADKRAWKRWKGHGNLDYMYQMVNEQGRNGECEPWQIYRKVTRRCSCWMCGNERRHFGKPTVQERRMVGAGVDGWGE
jgi:hypothetical protein